MSPLDCFPRCRQGNRRPPRRRGTLGCGPAAFIRIRRGERTPFAAPRAAAKRCRIDVDRNCASSSLSAATALTATMANGRSSAGGDENSERYSSGAYTSASGVRNAPRRQKEAGWAASRAPWGWIEQPDRHVEASSGYGLHLLIGPGQPEIRLQFDDIPETILRHRPVAAKLSSDSPACPCRAPAGPRSMRPGRVPPACRTARPPPAGVVAAASRHPHRCAWTGWPPPPWPITTAVAALAMPVMLWCSASQWRR